MTDTSSVAPAPIPVKEGEIPLPPREMWDALAHDAPAEPDTRVAVAPTQVGPTVAALEFIGDKKPARICVLDYPFRWNGIEVSEIVVRRLTTPQVAAFMERLPEDRSYDRYDLYGLMCGLPAEVLRALPEPDGPEVVGACFDFLPRVLAGAGD